MVEGPAERGLAGQVVLVTGSSSGIGAATAELLAAGGAIVVVSSARSIDAGQAVAERLGGGASYVRADVADAGDAARLVDTVADRYGRIDALVNNAGVTERIPHADLAGASPDVWRRIFDVNVVGTWQVTVAAVPHLQASGHGQVMNVSSMAGVRPTGSSIPYACSKAALNHMTLLLANVLGPGVRVNAVAPGLVDTPWTAEWHDVRDAVRARAPLGRSAMPEDVARAILGLMLADYVTGEVLVVDGGLQLR
ncbi:MAG: SDR family NAD(P)-dependent oxidoreductase [Acidimicrobiales bacterium]